MFFFIQPCVTPFRSRHSVSVHSTSPTSFTPSLTRFKPHFVRPHLRVSGVPARFSRTTPSMKDDGGGGGLAIRIVAVALIAGTIVSTFLPLTGLLSNSLSGNSEAVVKEKLSKVPLFTVTDSTGRPVLSESPDGRLRRGFFFLQPEDARKYLKNVLASEEDAKLLAISMGDALKFIEMDASPAKTVPERYELLGDEHELQLANNMTDGKFQQAFGANGVPVFYVEGLAFRNEAGDGTVVPLFFEKERLDEALANLKKTDPNAAISEGDMQVIDIMQTVRELRNDSENKFGRVVFVPLVESMKTLNELNAVK